MPDFTILAEDGPTQTAVIRLDGRLYFVKPMDLLGERLSIRFIRDDGEGVAVSPLKKTPCRLCPQDRKKRDGCLHLAAAKEMGLFT